MSKPECELNEKYGRPRRKAGLCGADKKEVAEYALSKAEKEK